MDNYNEIINDYLNNIGNYDTLTEKEEVLLLNKYIVDKDETAKEKLIVSNLRLVVSTAKKYTKVSNMELIDLVQEGNIGLIRAIDKFDLKYSNRFSTYAMHWIKQSIRSAINDKSRNIRIPSYLQTIRKQIVDAELKFIEDYDEVPSDVQLSEITGIQVSKITEIKNHFKDTVSLESTQDEESGSLSDYVSDESSIDDSLLENELKSEIHKVLDTLPHRERMVLIYRYGLDGEAPLTLEDVSKKIGGITRERVRQIEKRAFKRIMQSENKNKLMPYLE